MLRRLLREPLLFFLLAGAALFLLAGRFGGDDARRIEISQAERTRLAHQWEAQMGRPPGEAEMAGLLDQWLREEIYYREALALGLEADDVIIRRRLVQKLTFLTEDLATLEAPSDDALRAYHQANAERYAEPLRISFTHRFFSSDRRDDAEADARAALAALATTEGAPTPSDGDPFTLPRSFVERSQREITRLFGREFAAALAQVPTGSWQGPVASAYGWHLVRVEQVRPARPLAFEEVSDQVAADMRESRRRSANEAFYQSLLERYEVTEP